MTTLTIPYPIKNILIVGNCAGKTDKLIRAKTLIPNYDLTVFIGGVYYSWQIHEEVNRNIEIMKECLQTGTVAYCLSGDEVQLIGGMLENITPEMFDFYHDKCPNLVEAQFINGNKIVVTNGGITPKTDLKKIYSVIQTSFTEEVDHKPWHQSYDGRFGYVVSNNPLTRAEPKFYNFSCQIGNERGDETQVYAQEADQLGLKRTILL